MDVLDKNVSLYLVPTPIGNMLDMTFRSIEVLKQVDIILCEDTRNTKVLCSHFDISTPLMCYHIFNEDSRCDEVIGLLNEGKKLALVSDAGLPGISDPGYLLTKRALENGFEVRSLPGASAGITALVASGLPCDRFYFYGFLDHKKSQKVKELTALCDFKNTIIFYESPHRINETIELMFDIYKDRNIVIARELTKKFEEYIRGNIKDIINMDLNLKGEIVILVEGAKISQIANDLNSKTVLEHYNYYIDLGLTDMNAMKMVSKDRGVSKSVIYKEIKG